MQARAQPSGSERQFPLMAALAISVLLHFLLAAVAGWLPPLRPTHAAEVSEDTTLRFTFAQPAETEEREAVPEGDVPFETPQLQPSADLKPPPPDPGFEPTPPILPSPETPSLVDPAQAQQTPEESAEAEQSSPLATPDFPEQTDAPLLREPDVESSPEPSESTEAARSFDLNRALHDFGRALDQARTTNPPPQPPPGSGPPRNVFVPDPGDFATTGYGMGNLVFETREFDWSDYARAIYVQIWRAWHNRLLRMVNEFEKWSWENRQAFINHANQIRFVIERSGEVSEIMIDTPSGCVPLDDSATSALAEVILPPLPDAFPKDREVVHARFIATGEIRNMRPHLTRLKALNYF